MLCVAAEPRTPHHHHHHIPRYWRKHATLLWQIHLDMTGWLLHMKERVCGGGGVGWGSWARNNKMYGLKRPLREVCSSTDVGRWAQDNGTFRWSIATPGAAYHLAEQLMGGIIGTTDGGLLKWLHWCSFCCEGSYLHLPFDLPSPPSGRDRVQASRSCFYLTWGLSTFANPTFETLLLLQHSHTAHFCWFCHGSLASLGNIDHSTRFRAWLLLSYSVWTYPPPAVISHELNHSLTPR